MLSLSLPKTCAAATIAGDEGAESSALTGDWQEKRLTVAYRQCNGAVR